MRKAQKYISENFFIVLAVCVILFVVIQSLLGLWKYQNFFYNALDFAIFNQTFFNISIGKFFTNTIHPPSYLADHFTPLLAVLAILYAPFKHPVALIILQNIALGLGAWAIFLISKIAAFQRSWKFDNKFFGLLAAVSYLVNPFILNISLFEFEMLAFAIPLLLMTFYFYQKQNFRLFALFSLLALAVREDVAIVIFMFGILALIEKKELRWIITPIFSSALYFLVAIKIIAIFNPESSYKFFIYYSWLGQKIQPLLVIRKFFTLGSIEMIAGLLLPFAFLPLLRPKYLLLALPAYLQFALGSGGASFLILQTHYSALFLPALFVGYIQGAFGFLQKKSGTPFLKNNFALFPIIVITAVIYGSATLGPHIGTFHKIAARGIINQEAQIKHELVSMVPKNAPVLATYDFLLHVSSRPNVYALNYTFIGRQQFSKKPYTMPDDTEYILADFSDFLTYEVQYKNHTLYKTSYTDASQRLKKQLEEKNFGLVRIIGKNALLKKNYDSATRLFEIQKNPSGIADKDTILVNNAIAISGIDISKTQNRVLPFTINWARGETTELDYHTKFTIQESSGNIVSEMLLPMAYGLYPTNKWQDEETVTIHYWFPTKGIPPGRYALNLELFEITGGGMYVQADRSTKPLFQLKKSGETISLGNISL